MMYGFPKRDRYTVARPRLYSVSPASLANGCVLWCSAQFGVVRSGDTVTQWTNIVDPTKSLAGQYAGPQYVADAIGGRHPALRVSSFSQVMSMATFSNIQSVFVLAKNSVNRAYPDIVGTLGLSRYYLHGGTSALIEDVWRENNSATLDVYINGVTVAHSVARPTDHKLVSIVSSSGMVFNALGVNSYDSGNRWWEGDFAEFVMFTSQVTGDQRVAIEQSIMQRYGLTA